MKSKTASLLVAICALLLCWHAEAQTNLISNPDFSDPVNPMLGWRISFPYEGWYVNNANYVKPTTEAGKTCAVVDLPPGIAGNQGGKIEGAFVKAEPGATYRVDVDCMTGDFSAKLHAEAWTHDPKPTDKPDKFRVPAAPDHPAFVMCYRAQLPDPPAGSKTWSTTGREFILPPTVLIAGEEQKPEFLSLKVVIYGATPNGGKSWFTNFKLIKIKPAPTP